jgi:hypothetical protein
MVTGIEVCTSTLLRQLKKCENLGLVTVSRSYYTHLVSTNLWDILQAKEHINNSIICKSLNNFTLVTYRPNFLIIN